MGGRGSVSASAASGAIGSAAPIEVKNERHASSGNRWAHLTLEATDDGSGNLQIGYPRAKSYDNPNRNTTIATYELKAGFYTESGNRSIQSHNINMDRVKSVKGSTFDIKNYLKSEGFRWDPDSKSWTR